MSLFPVEVGQCPVADAAMFASRLLLLKLLGKCTRRCGNQL
jgi:hypothetical protein